MSSAPASPSKKRRRVKSDVEEPSTTTVVTTATATAQISTHHHSSREKRRRVKSNLEEPSSTTTAVTTATALETPAAASTETPTAQISTHHHTSREEKLQAISKLLRHWRWTFGDLCLAWLQRGSGKRQALKKKKSRDLILALLKDEVFFKMFEEVEELHGTLIDLVIRLLRAELDDLQRKTVLFGSFNKEMNFTDLDIEKSRDSVQQHAPLLFQLVEGLSQQSRLRGNPRNRHTGRIILIASIFSLGRARNTANCFARLLGIHLQDLGVKRSVLSLLHGFGIIDGYKTINRQRAGLAEPSNEDSDNGSISARADVGDGGDEDKEPDQDDV
ncbi:hypothetical protein Egran_00749 [Elaphomyces granulatus]|uniref:Uncharacterized protein n=1 Tax=Elaphomyces granulatus TaxID=519963 RepID=A0A232M4X8_9EURO|nr:hypothetical protein Egran_00749 [Elaphomyces granulatus]